MDESGRGPRRPLRPSTLGGDGPPQGPRSQGCRCAGGSPPAGTLPEIDNFQPRRTSRGQPFAESKRLESPSSCQSVVCKVVDAPGGRVCPPPGGPRPVINPVGRANNWRPFLLCFRDDAGPSNGWPSGGRLAERGGSESGAGPVTSWRWGSLQQLRNVG